MTTFTTDEIQSALDEITQENDQNNGFISVEYTEKDTIIVRYRDMKYRTHDARDSIDITSSAEGKKRKISINYEEGPDITLSFGHVDEHPPMEKSDEMVGEMGGDQCRNSNRMNYYGTISFYSKSVSYEASGRCNSRCTAAPALVSNNHVIARSDAGQRGESIWTPFRSDVARLECFVPLRCISSADFAMAKVNNMAGITTWTVRTIGRLAGVRRPRIGEGIKKHGARTGYTTGRVTGQSNIRVGSYTYYRVFVTNGGFGCAGDSGSSVVANNNDLVGIYSWGDDVPCSNNPRGYFWTLENPGSLNHDNHSTQVSIDTSND